MSFHQFSFHPTILAAISACGFDTPTPIQQQAMGPVMEGRDLLGLAQTGTGKTAAFVLPILQRLHKVPSRKIRALIVAPTRELAEQINGEIERMSAGTGLRSVVVYGGVSKNVQAGKIRAGVDIIVACPGRLLDLLNDRVMSLSGIEVLVLDEADHMFDRGFLPDVRRILRQLPAVRQTLVFSATMPTEIRKLTNDILTNPMTVQINHVRPVETVTHSCLPVLQEHKAALLKALLEQGTMTSTLIFTRTKHKAKSLALHLERSGYRAASIQGNLSQQRRQQALDGFRDGTYSILVATDIAARGIDVTGISHVINYDVPDTVETYTHRTGRTGRAERTGEALTFATAEDIKFIAMVEHFFGKRMNRPELPVFVVDASSVIAGARPESPIRNRRPMQTGRRSSGADGAGRSSGARKNGTASQGAGRKTNASKNADAAPASRAKTAGPGVFGFRAQRQR